MEGIYKKALINLEFVNFSYFIKLAIQSEISWIDLENILEDLTPTLDKSKQLNKVFLNEFKALQSQKSEAIFNTENKSDLNDSNLKLEDDSTSLLHESDSSNGPFESENIEQDWQDQMLTEEKEITDPDRKGEHFDKNQVDYTNGITEQEEANSSEFGHENSEAEMSGDRLENEEDELFQAKDSEEISNNIETNAIKIEKDSETGPNEAFEINPESKEDILELEENLDEKNNDNKDKSNSSGDDTDQEITSTKPKPYHCLPCDKGYTRLRDFKAHVSRHTGEKLYYDCKTCSKKFIKKYYLTRHERIHSNVAFQCRICLRSYRTVSDLLRHKRKIHSEEV